MTIELGSIASGYSTGLINDNFQAIEEYVNNNLLNRDGLSSGEVNQMETDLDMNGQAILNAITDLSEPGSLMTVGDADARYLSSAGASMSGVLDMGGNRIINLPAPSDPSDAARLEDVQDALAGGSATLITFDPYGDVSASNVQTAMEEVIDGVDENTTTLSQRKIQVLSIVQAESLDVSGLSAGTTLSLPQGDYDNDYKWTIGDLSAEVAGDPSQDTYIAPSSDPTGASGAWVRVTDHEPDTTIGGSQPLSESTATSSSVAPAILKLLPLDYVNIEWFGGGTSGFSGSANATALTNALAEDKKVVLRRGVYNMASVEHTLTSQEDLNIVGEGQNATILNFGSETEGFKVNIDQIATQMWGKQTNINIAGIAFAATGSGTLGYGLWLDYPNSTAGGGAGLSIYRSISDLKFTGLSPAHYIDEGLRLTNGSNFIVSNISGQGPQGGIGGRLIHFNGNKLSVENRFYNIYANGMDEGIRVDGQQEGTTISQSNFVGVNRGVYASVDQSGVNQGKPLFFISDCHMNCLINSLQFEDVGQLYINNCLFYIHSDSAANARGISIENINAPQSSNHQINNVGIFNVATGQQTRRGIFMGAGTGSSIISNIRGNRLFAGITMAEGSNDNIGGDSLFTTTTNAIVDNGTNNTVTAING